MLYSKPKQDCRLITAICQTDRQLSSLSKRAKKYRWTGHAYLWHYSTTSHSPRPQNLLRLAAEAYLSWNLHDSLSYEVLQSGTNPHVRSGRMGGFPFSFIMFVQYRFFHKDKVNKSYTLSQHRFHPMDRIPKITLKGRMAAQEITVAIRKKRIQFRRHTVNVGTDSILYVIPLSLAVRKLIHTKLLMKETVSLLYDSPIHYKT